MTQKPWVSIDGQIRILEHRGLEDAKEFRDALETIGYYRLSGYSYPFRRLAGDESHRRLDEFEPGTRMWHVLKIYDFDDRLRLAVWRALSKLEVCLRVDIGHILGEMDPFIHLDVDKRWSTGKGKDRATRFLEKLKKSQELSSEDFVKHHNEVYGGKMPVWAVTELLEFGQLVTLFSLAPFDQRRSIAKGYGVRADELESWTRTANYVRNMCAHHVRLWNKNLVIRPLTKHRRTDPLLSAAVHAGGRTYGALVLIAFLLRRGNFTNEIRGIYNVLQSFPSEIPYVSLRQTGAPPDWADHAIWKI